MSNIMPEGEALRKAVKWISENHSANPAKPIQELVNDASMRFDLPPNDEEFLIKFFRERKED